MSKVIGFLSKNETYHHKICPHCRAIIEFNNFDIIRDEMGCEIVCPNCYYIMKF